ncbi:hypothetical protein PVW51_07840 [Sulfitobacter sp. PR48]|uniref:hypothetical protein n=1 Tax=Sulfitobacter sp. PR48 TaxID=3028383 RepID=UPI00237BBAC5|nr:hypothetical protein [Sulfitobacter sp. PR48]MDD9720600.1 hypothetical protein [Sulfitobacter sp. PR48]
MTCSGVFKNAGPNSSKNSQRRTTSKKPNPQIASQRPAVFSKTPDRILQRIRKGAPLRKSPTRRPRRNAQRRFQKRRTEFFKEFAKAHHLEKAQPADRVATPGGVFKNTGPNSSKNSQRRTTSKKPILQIASQRPAAFAKTPDRILQRIRKGAPLRKSPTRRSRRNAQRCFQKHRTEFFKEFAKAHRFEKAQPADRVATPNGVFKNTGPNSSKNSPPHAAWFRIAASEADRLRREKLP